MKANEILNTKKPFVVIGVSQDESKYGFEVFHALLEHKYKAYPINPKSPVIAGHQCFSSLNEQLQKPEVIMVIMAPNNTSKIIDNLLAYKYAIIWFPPECWSEEVI